MKQILLSLVAILFCCCSSDSDVKAEVPVGTAKTLVVYYSYTGNCREIVNTLTSQIQADVLEIQPAEKGLRYEANNYALGMQLLTAIKADPDNESSYPAIDPVNVSLSHYQNIIRNAIPVTSSRALSPSHRRRAPLLYIRPHLNACYLPPGF